MDRPFRVGIGGPVGAGKTSLIENLVAEMTDRRIEGVVITNDITSKEDAERLRENVTHFIEPDRIRGVETGACPHTAVRDDPSMNLRTVEELEASYPEADLLLLESGGDNLTLSFSSSLVDFFVYVLDVAGGDDVPAKGGPGVAQSDLLVFNKIDLADAVGSDIDRMEADAREQRGDAPLVLTDCRTGEGIPEMLDTILEGAGEAPEESVA